MHEYDKKSTESQQTEPATAQPARKPWQPFGARIPTHEFGSRIPSNEFGAGRPEPVQREADSAQADQAVPSQVAQSEQTAPVAQGVGTTGQTVQREPQEQEDQQGSPTATDVAQDVAGGVGATIE